MLRSVSTSIDQLNSIGSLIRSAACDMAKFLKTIMGQIQDFVTDLTNKLLQPVIKVSPPTIRIEMLENLVKGLETISCVFNAIGIDLVTLLRDLSEILSQEDHQVVQSSRISSTILDRAICRYPLVFTRGRHI